LNKPRGITSRDAVDRVEERVPEGKVGHAGTLDRAAEGLLPVMIGFATRLVPYLQERKKTYRVTARFDLTSETLDLDGTVRPRPPRRVPSRGELMEVLQGFVGSLEQAPPVYSAIKQNGHRLHERARRGELQEVDVESRRVECHRIEVAAFSFPVLTLRVTCGKGFYVRALVRDLGRALGMEGGVVTGLIRTRYGPYRLEDAVSPDRPETWPEGFHPPRSAVEHLEAVRCDADRLEHIRHGRWIPRPEPDGPSRAVAVDGRGRVRAILEAVERDGQARWQPRKVFCS